MDADKGGQDRELISFPRWAEVLAQAAAMPAGRREAYRCAIIAFLGFCKRRHAGASVILIQSYLSGLPEQERSGAREALRWWYRAAGGRDGQRRTGDSRRMAEDGSTGSQRPEAEAERRRWANGGVATKDNEDKEGPKGEGGEQMAGVKPAPPGGALAKQSASGATIAAHRQAGVPPPAAASDLGRADWERDLIKACRERGFLWRTEETYRAWSRRFAAFLRPRSPYAADKDDVSAFLSHLAVTQRASGSTQKQALNAIVFLMQEALHRELGELDFQRAARKVRVPTVLSVDECQRLFAQLGGTPQLMAQLAYGAGLRLMELIRLRVHHLDLDRRQLRVLGGKGRVKGFAPRGFCTA